MDQSYAHADWVGYVRNRGNEDDDDDEEDERYDDDGPLLEYKNEKCRRYRHYEAGESTKKSRRSTLSIILKFTLFCTAMIILCVLMYIPMYNGAIDNVPKHIVPGWPVHINRDIKIYIQPENITTIHEPKSLCRNKTFLLIVVCSDIKNFERREIIRESWADFEKYLVHKQLFAKVRKKYSKYDYSFDLFRETTVSSVIVNNRTRREAGLVQLLPKLAEALKNSQISDLKPATEENRFEDDNVLQEFDMNKEFNEDVDYDDDYPSNVMKIPPKGVIAEQTHDIKKVMALLKKSETDVKTDVKNEVDVSASPVKNLVSDRNLDYKIAFLIGMPAHDNNSEIQNRIDEESLKYGDVIQESFLDTYNNLTLKSAMLLKYVIKNCKDTIRYVAKTDDDVYVNIPNLVAILKNKSEDHDRIDKNKPEYLLLGSIVKGAKPIHDANNKWFSPRYMYGGRKYPKYLSGPGYVMSIPTAKVLYTTALATQLFYIEDIFITGICALRSKPRIKLDTTPDFLPMTDSNEPCDIYSYVVNHHIAADVLKNYSSILMDDKVVDVCERKRLTQVRKYRLKIKNSKEIKKIAKKFVKRF